MPSISPEEFVEILPIAHKYDFKTALEDCKAAEATFDYSKHSAAQLLGMLQMAEELQVRTEVMRRNCMYEGEDMHAFTKETKK